MIGLSASMSPPRPCFTVDGEPIPGRTLLSCRIGPGPHTLESLTPQIGRVAAEVLVDDDASGDFIDDSGLIRGDAMLQLNGHSLARRPGIAW